MRPWHVEQALAMSCLIKKILFWFYSILESKYWIVMLKVEIHYVRYTDTLLVCTVLVAVVSITLWVRLSLTFSAYHFPSICSMMDPEDMQEEDVTGKQTRRARDRSLRSKGKVDESGALDVVQGDLRDRRGVRNLPRRSRRDDQDDNTSRLR